MVRNEETPLSQQIAKQDTILNSINQEPILKEPSIRRTLVIFITSFIILIFICAGVIAGTKQFGSKRSKNASNVSIIRVAVTSPPPNRQINRTITPSIIVTNGECKNYGALPKDQYLPKYTVMENETLASISAKLIPQNPESTQEIVSLNDDIYPKLDYLDENATISAGWQLFYPLRLSHPYFGQYQAMGGKISRISLNQVAIETGPSLTYFIYTNADTEYASNKSSLLHIGNCISAVTSDGHTTLYIFQQ